MAKAENSWRFVILLLMCVFDCESRNSPYSLFRYQPKLRISTFERVDLLCRFASCILCKAECYLSLCVRSSTWKDILESKSYF